MPLSFSVLLQLLAFGAPTPAYAERFRMWESAGRPVSLVAYSFPAVNTHGAAVTVTLREWSSTPPARHDSTLEASCQASAGDHASLCAGLITIDRAETMPSWSLTANGSTDDPTAVVVGQGVQLPRGDDAIQLSDILLGTNAGSTTWAHGETRTVVSLFGTFNRSEPIQVSYQAWSAVPRARVRITMTVTDVTDVHHGRRVMTAAADASLLAGVTDYEHDIDVAHLHPGRYLIEIQVGDLVHGGASVRSVEFTLR